MLSIVSSVVCIAVMSQDIGSTAASSVEPNQPEHLRPVTEGDDGWLFLASEIRFVQAGSFWGEHAAPVSRARKPEWADPEPAILDFAQQLQDAGIRLLVVPVPAKATVMKEHLKQPDTVPVHSNLQAFLERLRSADVEVLDLQPHLQAVSDSGQQGYLKTDTHWSPVGLQRAADLISGWLIDQGVAAPNNVAPAMVEKEVQLRGDLVQMRDGGDGPSTEVTTVMLPELAWGPVSRDSPVVLLGDSHALVYSTGDDMHATDAGLAEHISAQLGHGVDRVAVRGSGATATRIELLRRRDQLKGKKAVVWVFAARDLTESDGWRQVPVISAKPKS